MTKAFLITGLPRSRTAWLAAVANTVPDAVCHHEPLERFPSWQASLSLWSKPNWHYCHVGISDSALGFHLVEILASHAPRVLIVKRDQREVAGSLESLALGGDPRRYCALLGARLRAAQDHPLVKTVDFAALADADVVRDCLDHLMPGAEIGVDKIALMQRLNVQADMRHVRKTAQARKADIPALLGHDVFAEVCA